MLNTGTDRRPAQKGHQAQYAKMEILSVTGLTALVSGQHNWPAPDTLTTFQNSKYSRVLISRNTKRIFSI